MTPRSWIRRRRTVAAAALGFALLAAIALGIIWFGWDWKALIGWRALVDYINPRDATGRKDAVQVYAVIVAGAVATITAAVGLANLHLARKNLEQQRELEAQRGRGTALQAYYEQMGKLLAEKGLNRDVQREIRELARAQTLTLLRDLSVGYDHSSRGSTYYRGLPPSDATRKGNLVVFLHAAGLIEKEGPAVELRGADLHGAYLGGANLRDADLQATNLTHAALGQANL